MSYRILFAEDEQILRQLVKDALEKQGYEVTLVSNGSDALAACRRLKPHLCLLDIMLPGKDGYDVARQIRSIESQVPIIFLTAKVQTADVVAGFKAGANDYVRKPFSIDELLVRMETWLREKYGQPTPQLSDEHHIGNFIFYPHKHILVQDTKEILLTHKEAAILSLLYTHRNHVTAREHILEKVWGMDTIHNSRTLDVYINRLRKHFRQTPVQIITLKGVGYRFIF